MNSGNWWFPNLICDIATGMFGNIIISKVINFLDKWAPYGLCCAVFCNMHIKNLCEENPEIWNYSAPPYRTQ